MRRPAPLLGAFLALALVLALPIVPAPAFELAGEPAPSTARVTAPPGNAPAVPTAAASSASPSANAPSEGAAATTPGVDQASSTAATTASIATLIGQKLVVAMDGSVPSSSLLGRVRRGEVGGVIIFRRNITSASALRTAIASLQAAARAGGQPRLLVMADQEGGTIRTLSWAPPTYSAVQMGPHSATWIRGQGAATGTALAAVGINVDLAPVADVPSSTSSFMYQQGRTFSFSASRVAADTVAFAAGLRSKGILVTAKHFPGIGRVRLNTDRYVQTVTASRSALATDLTPYRSLLGGSVQLVMLSNATYTAYDSANAAGWSRAIGVDLLRATMGWRGVTITDSLDGTAHARGVSEASLAIKAAAAATDLLLLTGSEATTAATFKTLVAKATAGSIPRLTLEHSFDRILALKAMLAP